MALVVGMASGAATGIVSSALNGAGHWSDYAGAAVKGAVIGGLTAFASAVFGQLVSGLFKKDPILALGGVFDMPVEQVLGEFSKSQVAVRNSIIASASFGGAVNSFVGNMSELLADNSGNGSVSQANPSATNGGDGERIPWTNDAKKNGLQIIEYAHHVNLTRQDYVDLNEVFNNLSIEKPHSGWVKGNWIQINWNGKNVNVYYSVSNGLKKGYRYPNKYAPVNKTVYGVKTPFGSLV